MDKQADDTTKKDDTTESTDTRPSSPAPVRTGKDAKGAEQSEPGTGGVSKPAYDDATEKAVKDVHG